MKIFKNILQGVLILTVVFTIAIAFVSKQISDDIHSGKVNISELASQSSDNTDIIQHHIEQLNQRCPININGGGTIISVALDMEIKEIVYKLSSDYANWETVSKSYEDFMEYSCLYQFVVMKDSHSEYTRYLDAVISEGYSTVFEMPSGERISIEADLLRKAKQKVLDTPKSAVQRLLSLYVSTNNANLPQEFDDVNLLKITYDEFNETKHLIFNMQIHGDTSISYIRSNKVEVHNSMKNTLETDPMYKGALVICDEAGAGITFRFHSEDMQESCDIVFDNNEGFHEMASEAFETLNRVN